MSYTHLSLEERHYIEIRKKKGESANLIAKALKRSQPTISREIKRNTGLRGYRHNQANDLAASRHREALLISSEFEHFRSCSVISCTLQIG